MSNVKGKIESYSTVNGRKHEFEFQFNPTEISEERSVKYNFSEAQGQILPLAQYGRIEPTKITFTLFGFSRDRKALEYLKNIRRLTLPKSMTLNAAYEQVAPHVYLLNLKEYGIWTGVFDSVSIRVLEYDKFDLRPKRFTSDISFVGVSVDDAIDMTRINSRAGASRASSILQDEPAPAIIRTANNQSNLVEENPDRPANLTTELIDIFMGN